jgi:hypothetical protein
VICNGKLPVGVKRGDIGVNSQSHDLSSLIKIFGHPCPFAGFMWELFLLPVGVFTPFRWISGSKHLIGKEDQNLRSKNLNMGG